MTSTYLLDSIVNNQLDADRLLSQARVLRFEMKHRPSAPHPRGRGWLSPEKAALLGLVITAAEHVGRAEKSVNRMVDDVMSEYEDLIGLGEAEATRSIVRRSVEEQVTTEHRLLASGRYGKVEFEARHRWIAIKRDAQLARSCP